MLDMVVIQYMLNGGIVMRQAHDTDDEHHIEIGASDLPGSSGGLGLPSPQVPELPATYSCADEVD
jgi:hypothetical protein